MLLPNVTALIFLLIGLSGCATLSVVDARRLIMPDSVMAIVTLAALGFHYSTGWLITAPQDAAFGALIGSAVLFALRITYQQLRGIQAIGLGDVKFMIAAGAWVGASQLPMLLLIASLSTLVAVLFFRMVGFMPGSQMRERRIPFGPGLCIALVLTVMELLRQSVA